MNINVKINYQNRGFNNMKLAFINDYGIKLEDYFLH